MSILSSKKEKIMEKGLSGVFSIAIVAITLVLLSSVAAVCIYGLNDRKLMAANIENAITKGIDPLAVRCSYAKSDDIVCIAHAANRK
jgi:hypothetical protein